MLVALPALLMTLGSLAAAQTEPTCTRLDDCRQLALDAAAREDFETFHSLAWRAMQTGKPNDADLMFMLARAQSLSGRPDDALVMLRRLADRGVTHPEVETLDDFKRVRDMAGWPDLLERMRDNATSPAPPTPAPSTPAPIERPAPPPPAPSVSKPPTPTAATLVAPPSAGPKKEPAEAAHSAVPIATFIPVPSAVTAPVAMAYDKVSARMIIADDSTGTLKVVSELSGNAVDLVSAGWGGGYQTNAMVIDSTRGDLWVAGTRIGEAPESVIHRLQLISGRLLYSVPRPEEFGATRFASVALSSTSVFVLDADGRRIFELSRGARTLRMRAPVPQPNPTSLTLAGDTVAYVSHAGGILRVDLTTRRSGPVAASPGIELDGIEWIGYFDNSLLAVQRRADGARAAVRFRLGRGGRTVTAVDTFGVAAAKGAAVLEGTFFYVSAQPEGTAVARVHLGAGPARKPRQ